VGWTNAEAHANAQELLEVAKPHLDHARAKQETEAVARWQEETGRNGRAVAGWEQTREAASDGRGEPPPGPPGANREAYQCPQCGRGSAEDGSCPLDGRRLERRDDGLDLAVHHVLAHGGAVVAVGGTDLAGAAGIGALLRF